jgi:2-dehydro-3-deoxyphosphogluconate aldolase / (4S)-4-hydroxy-2-oxoglutarate aldolase
MTADELMGQGPFIPVITIERVSDAVPLARALVAGGVRVLEVTLRTPAALEAIQEMSHVQGAIVGAGTVLNGRDAERAAAAGARFLISPGLTEPLARAATELRLPCLGGVATPGDVMRGLDMGLDRFKFFPAETYGGAATLKAFAGPFPQVRFCPTGGITEASAPSYLALPNVACVGGTFVTPKAAIDAGAWADITELARRASALSAHG